MKIKTLIKYEESYLPPRCRKLRYRDCREISSEFFPRLWRDGEHPDRNHMIEMARKETRQYLLVDGELYKRTAEPRYVVNTFGLGHNHGGTGMLCEYYYNTNISKDNYFSALDGEKAVAYANKVAAGRGDTKDVGKFKPFIVCHMPEIVKVKPKKQHGNGDNFLNDCEKVICGADSAFEAGLLVMAMAMK